MRPTRLSASFAKTVREPGVYGDGRGGHGLALRVWTTANGRLGKCWTQRLRINGRVTNLGLGSYPVVSLAEARAKALTNRRAVAQGMDPRGGGIPTLAEASEKVIAIHAKNWKGTATETQWRREMSLHVLPKIGAKRVDKITTPDLLVVLVPIWSEKPVVARRLRLRIGSVMRWAIAAGYRQDDPAGSAITAALPAGRRPIKHHRAVPHAELAMALARIDEGRARPTTKLAIRFIALTAVRSGEAREATWSEISGDTWTIPATRTKKQREFRVPLSVEAVAVLIEVQRLSGTKALIFPGTEGRPISKATLSLLFKTMRVPGTVHGMRSSFRDWCGETGVPREVAEQCLAHAVRNPVEAAYARSDLFEPRRRVMERWGQYIGGISCSEHAISTIDPQISS